MIIDNIDNVFDFSKKVLDKKPKHVWLDDQKIIDLSEQMKKDGKIDFYNADDSPNSGYKLDIKLDVIKELVASSINYNYWLGASDLRPNDVNSQTMYDDVNACFDSAKNKALNFEIRIEQLIQRLSINRYPLLEKRRNHLLELCYERRAENFCNDVIELKEESNIDNVFNQLIVLFPGFASDIFLKRASLFFIQLYRKFGWYNSYMQWLFVPADYQVPKILRHFDCIKYSNDLAKKVLNGVLIQKNSLEELQIRAATITACEKLKNLTGFNISDVDTYLWCRRKETKTPFHCTYTTDY